MKKVRKNCKWFWNVDSCKLFSLLISVILYVFLGDFGLWVALTVISYPIMVLASATILRMRGDITEKSFICLVLEGFKPTGLIKKLRRYSTSLKLRKFKKTKKSCR